MMAAAGMSPPVSNSDLTFVGSDLNRPECVLCTSDGSIYVSDWRGGVCQIREDDQQTLYLANEDPETLRPNGIALMPDGSFLLASLGDRGGVWRLFRDGALEPFLTEVAGHPLPPSNFVMLDHLGRTWITVSTRRVPRALGYRKDVDDGFIVLVDDRGARVVADGLGYTNEAQFDPAREWLYVNETFARRLTRFRVQADGSLTDRETFAQFGHGTYPDGLAFDQDGGIWVVSIISNRVLRLAGDGHPHLVIEDSDAAHLEQVEKAFQNDRMGRIHLDRVRSRSLRNVSSIAFSGPKRRTALLGCLLGSELAGFESPWAGSEPVHWNWTF